MPAGTTFRPEPPLLRAASDAALQHVPRCKNEAQDTRLAPRRSNLGDREHHEMNNSPLRP
jgi:hypothetical protein